MLVHSQVGPVAENHQSRWFPASSRLTQHIEKQQLTIWKLACTLDRRVTAMHTFFLKPNKAGSGLAIGLLVCSLAFSQTSEDTSGGWRRISQVQTPQAPDPQMQAPQAAQQPPLPQWSGDAAPTPSQAPSQQNVPRMLPPPADNLVIRPGTYVTVRIDQALSSDHSQPGDAFSATLVKPIVVDGVVVAYPGQTVEGQVMEAQKAGRAGGNVSRLVIQLTALSVADGTQVPVHSQLIARSGGSTAPRDFGVIAGTTATGAAIGAMADGGFGAGIGAAVGAAAGTVGVLLTRGQPTIVYPETVLTFRVDAPVNVSTARSPQAFRYVEPADYDRPPASLQPQAQVAPQPRPAACGQYGCPPPYYPSYPYYWGAPAPYWGPTVYFGAAYWGPRVWVGPAYYHGYYRGYHH